MEGRSKSSSNAENQRLRRGQAFEPETPFKVLHLEITRSGDDRLKTSLTSGISSYRDTLRTYEQSTVSLDGVIQRSQQMMTTLNQANRKGRLTKQLLQSLKETGQLLRDELLTSHLKEKLNSSDTDYMTLRIDEQLVHLPWELLHDGRQFLCQRFAVGRLVQTRQHVPGPLGGRDRGPLQVLVLADLDGSLPAARKEGAEVRDLIESLTRDVRVMMRSTHVRKNFLRTKIRAYDWVHFAGHCDYNDHPSGKSGWRLSDGWFTAEDAVKMAGTASMPDMIFANACQSARTYGWSLNDARQKLFFGMVNALLLAGTKHYVGTAWEIPDEPGRRFAQSFYGYLADGAGIGQAVMHARNHLMVRYGEDQVAWASYVLYGDPTHRYLTGARAKEYTHASIPGPSRRTFSAVPTTRASTSAEPGTVPPLPMRRRMPIVVLSLCLVVGIVLLAVTIPFNPLGGNQNRLRQATAAFHAGEYERVLDLCPPPADGAAPVVGCLLLRSRVLFVDGDLEGAYRLFGMASESPRATSIESAEALIGLGRIAAVRGDHHRAMVCYQQAAQLAPRQKEPVVALALINERLGKDREAVTLLETAKKLASTQEDLSIEALQRSLKAKIDLNNDKGRMERIDDLIDELSSFDPDAFTSGADTDLQFPRPIPVWIMEMETSGYSLQEGASQLMTTLIESLLQERSALRIVDRHFMAKTLSELKLGSSALVDQQTRLRLGRLQAVRLIINGRIIFSGAETQVALRCIDIETSAVTAVVVEAFESDLPIFEMARQMAEQLLLKLDQAQT